MQFDFDFEKDPEAFRDLALETEDSARESAIGRNICLGAFLVHETLVATLELTVMDMPRPGYVALLGVAWLAGAAGAEVSRRSMSKLTKQQNDLALGIDMLGIHEKPEIWEKRLKNTEDLE